MEKLNEEMISCIMKLFKILVLSLMGKHLLSAYYDICYQVF